VRRVNEADQFPAVSVVLPVLNEARDIERLLLEVLNQASPAGGFEVLVADGGSTDGTKTIVAGLVDRWPNLRLLDNPGRLSSAGRNVGAWAARGKYVLFVDGHCSIPRSDYLLRLVELFEATGAACLCRPQPLMLRAEGAWATAIAGARHSWLGHDVGSDIYGGSPGATDPRSAGAAYLRTVIEQLDGYDERFDACEDVEFNYRVLKAGHRSYRHPDLRIDYRPRSSLKSLFRQMMRYGKGRAQLMARHPGMRPWPLLVVSGVTLLVASLLAMGRTPVVRLMALVPVACWLIMIVGESLRVGGVSSEATRLMRAFLVIHCGLALGFWRGLLDTRRLTLSGHGGGPWRSSQIS
jgi:succinoglycan biosynthesis protein ExoA